MDKENKQTILAIDDAKDTLMLLDFDLSDAGYQVITATSAERAFLIIEEGNATDAHQNDCSITSPQIDLILLDMYMPKMSGLQTLYRLKSQSRTRDIPIIMLSASDDEDEIVEALELGADDYVTKPYIAKVLLARIKTSLRLLAKTKELELLAKTDFLTSLNNRATFYELTSKAISQCKRNEQSLIVAMFDIDWFKNINDDFGHDIGDLVLVEFAKILTLSFRDYDVVARIGGEEFAVCMPNTLINDAMTVCERFRKRIESHKVIIEHSKQAETSVTVSIGVASKIFDNKDGQVCVDVLLKLADQALYSAKNNGRNNVVSTDAIDHIDETLEIRVDDNFTGESLQLEDEISDNGNSYKDGCIASSVNNKVNRIKEDSVPGIDFAIGLANVLEDESLFREILMLFYQDHSLDGEKLKVALLTDDIKKAKHLIHTLKGVACSIGAMNLFEQSKILDTAINDNETLTFDFLFEQGVLPELNKVVSGIQAELNL